MTGEICLALTAAGSAVRVEVEAPPAPADVGPRSAEAVVLTAVVAQVAKVDFW